MQATEPIRSAAPVCDSLFAQRTRLGMPSSSCSVSISLLEFRLRLDRPGYARLALDAFSQVRHYLLDYAIRNLRTGGAGRCDSAVSVRVRVVVQQRYGAYVPDLYYSGDIPSPLPQFGATIRFIPCRKGWKTQYAGGRDSSVQPESEDKGPDNETFVLPCVKRACSTLIQYLPTPVVA